MVVLLDEAKMKSQFVKIKIFIQRAMSYMTIVSAGSLLFLVADRLPSYGIHLSIWVLAPILFFLSICFCLAVGWFDLVSGVYAEELSYGSKNNPMFVEILDRLKEIEERTKHLNK